MDAVLAGKTASSDEIVSAEGLTERHVRRLVPLAFLSPKIIQAIADGTGPAGLGVSSLTQALPAPRQHMRKCSASAELGSQQTIRVNRLSHLPVFIGGSRPHAAANARI